MKIRFLLFLALTVLAFSACNEIVDAERPIIDVELPTQNDIVITNDGLRIVATLSDDTGLLQYKVIFDGVDSENGIGSDSTSSFIMIDGVPNKDKAIYLDQVFPLSDTTFNGSYQIVLACIDIEGNESLKDTVQFTIRNSNDSEPPQFNVTGPTPGDTLGIGNGFSILGSTSDSQSLIYSDIYVGQVGGGDTILFFGFPAIQNNTVNYNNIGWYFQVDSSWTQGDYHMYIKSWDNYSGASHEIPFHVSY